MTRDPRTPPGFNNMERWLSRDLSHLKTLALNLHACGEDELATQVEALVAPVTRVVSHIGSANARRMREATHG